MGKAKTSPKRTTKATMGWRTNPAKRGITSFALNKATKALSTVSVDTATSSTQRGNIKVVVRVRPLNQRETTLNSRNVVHTVDAHMILFDPPDDAGPEFYYKGVRQNYQQGKRHKNLKLAFDNVYGPASTNLQIFEDVINPMLDTLLGGYNCSVFAYGATGSGKTHTMIGSKDNPGLTYQTVMELYRRLEEMKVDYETEVVVSYLEVYNEAIRDLLQTSAGDLQIREDTNGVIVSNLTTHKPNDSMELLDLLAKGNSVRSQHPTDHNAESSRSHAVFQVSIMLRSRFTELTNQYKSAKLVMVDLAGSEKGAATGFQGQRFREGASINKSLLALGNCINALADGKRHIPYRDSKLTRILKDSLGGNCKTVMIANVSPSSLSFDDSHNTLKYADRAKRIKFQVKKNATSVSACLTQYTKVVEEMSHKIELLEKELAEYKKKCNVQKIKVDVATETDLTPDSRNTPYAPLAVVQSIKNLTEMRLSVVKTINDASSVCNVSTMKIAVKEKRITTIQKLKSSGVENKTEKIKKQLEPLKDRRIQAGNKRDQAKTMLASYNNELIHLQRKNTVVGNVPVPISEFFILQNLKVENLKLTCLKDSYQEISKLYLEEWVKSENLLGKSVEFLSSQYLMSKHYKNNSNKNDVEYEKLVANLCGTNVQWSNDMDELDSDLTKKHSDDEDVENVTYCLPMPTIPIPSDDGPTSKRSKLTFNTHNRPQTPPPGTKSFNLADYVELSSDDT